MALVQPRPFTPVTCDQVFAAAKLPPPPNDPSPETFCQETPRYRLNILASHGDVLYFAYSRSFVARYQIHRSNGVMLCPLPACPVSPPTVINNMRVANFAPERGGNLMLMTGGSETSNANGTLTVLPLVALEDIHVARTFTLPVRSAWGLDVHDAVCRIAISSNSCAVLLLAIVTANTSINRGDSVSDEDDADDPAIVVSAMEPASDAAPVPAIIGFGGLDNDDVAGVFMGAGVQQQHDQGGEESPPEADACQQLQLVLNSEVLQDTHYNNIPCVAFAPGGDWLASASIDTTFALYDARSASSTQTQDNVATGVFVRQTTGRTVYHSGQGVRPEDDDSRLSERAWVVHWVSETVVSNLMDVPGRQGDLCKVRERWRVQHLDKVWLTDECVDIAVPKMLNIFHRAHDTRVDRRTSRHNDVILYDDSIDKEIAHDGCRDSDGEGGDRDDRHSPFESSRVTTHDNKVWFGYVSGEYAYLEDDEGQEGWQRWRRRQPQQQQNRHPQGNRLLLVCFEETIKLYRVSDDLATHVDSEGSVSGSDIELLDSLTIVSMGLWGPRQLMFTQVIEVAPLRALLVTAIGSGVIMLRIVTGVGYDDDDEMNKDQGDNTTRNATQNASRKRKPSLFVERVFETEADVAGVTVVERKGDCRLTTSFELWILQHSGYVECWDLSSDDDAVVDFGSYI